MGFTATKVADVLDRAHDEILVHGWGRGGRLEGAVCVQQAVALAVGRDRYAWMGHELCPVGRAAVLALQGRLADQPVWWWNDATERTEDEVLDLLRDTAKGLRNGEIEVPA